MMLETFKFPLVAEESITISSIQQLSAALSIRPLNADTCGCSIRWVVNDVSNGLSAMHNERTKKEDVDHQQRTSLTNDSIFSAIVFAYVETFNLNFANNNHVTGVHILVSSMPPSLLDTTCLLYTSPSPRDS